MLFFTVGVSNNAVTSVIRFARRIRIDVYRDPQIGLYRDATGPAGSMRGIVGRVRTDSTGAASTGSSLDPSTSVSWDLSSLRTDCGSPHERHSAPRVTVVRTGKMGQNGHRGIDRVRGVALCC